MAIFLAIRNILTCAASLAFVACGNSVTESIDRSTEANEDKPREIVIPQATIEKRISTLSVDHQSGIYARYEGCLSDAKRTADKAVAPDSEKERLYELGAEDCNKKLENDVKVAETTESALDR